MPDGTYYGQSVTRPNDTTPYNAGDVVGATAAALSFPIMGDAGSSVLITAVSLQFDISAVPSGMGAFILHLYNATPPSALADNAAFDVPSGDRAAYLGPINIGTPVDIGSTLYIEANQINKPVRLITSGLWGYLQTVAGWTPAAQAVHRLKLHGVRL